MRNLFATIIQPLDVTSWNWISLDRLTSAVKRWPRKRREGHINITRNENRKKMKGKKKYKKKSSFLPSLSPCCRFRWTRYIFFILELGAYNCASKLYNFWLLCLFFSWWIIIMLIMKWNNVDCHIKFVFIDRVLIWRLNNFGQKFLLQLLNKGWPFNLSRSSLFSSYLLIYLLVRRKKLCDAVSPIGPAKLLTHCLVLGFLFFFFVGGGGGLFIFMSFDSLAVVFKCNFLFFLFLCFFFLFSPSPPPFSFAFVFFFLFLNFYIFCFFCFISFYFSLLNLVYPLSLFFVFTISFKNTYSLSHTLFASFPFFSVWLFVSVLFD